MSAEIKIAFYLTPLIVVWLAYWYGLRRIQRHNLQVREAARQAGLTDPASLHPTIDPTRCIGCSACVNACPEESVLGLIGNKAELINPTHCIGHGACRAACPVDAITLVFGTEKRGVDIPLVKPNFETNVPGIFIAGELGGMGLIRNAVTQGKQAIDAIRRLKHTGTGELLDVIIVGAGPAGIAASLAATEHKLRFVTVEQDSLGGTVAHYPRGKIVMTAPVQLPIIGKVRMKETTKEALLALWQGVEKQAGLKIQYQERVEAITPTVMGFQVKTTHHTYQSRTVLLAIGRRGTPRKLDVPGEELSKVVYRLIDPEQYRGQHVLVVGGGDSAMEAATSIADEPGTTVTLSYRGDSFSRAKDKNRERVANAQNTGRLKVLLKSTVEQITENSVALELDGKHFQLPNDATIVCAGGVLPTPFLKSIGIEVETKFGTT